MQDCAVGVNRPYGGVIDAGADAAVMFETRRDMLGDTVALETPYRGRLSHKCNLR